MHFTNQKQPGATAKPLQRQCLYAVFDTEQEAHQAHAALTSAGVQPQLLLGRHHRGIMARIERFMMHFGEGLLGLQRYAVHVEGGRSVLAVASVDRTTAMQHFQTLAQHGAYDATYFGSWTAEYVGPIEKMRDE